MPTISCHLADLRQLLQEPGLTPEELEPRLDLVKGELKGHDEDELRIELNDTNRPDLWCAEGIARQLRGTVPVLAGLPPERELHVEWIPYRPFAACILARDVELTEPGLIQLIQTQEKLTDNFGHHRSSVSIGVYNARRITFPVHYRAVGRQERRFVPLGLDAELTLDEILTEHPKGQAYAHILAGQDQVPILEDDQGQILSFPPIINSRALGEVQPGDDVLMVEVTGTNLTSCLLVLNVFAANFADRGARVEPVTAVLPEPAAALAAELASNQRVVAPVDLGITQRVPVTEFRRLLGEATLAVDEIVDCLHQYGVVAQADGDAVEARCPPYRNDYLHPVDVIEDLAIARGYTSFEPVLPRDFTVGRLAPLTILGDRVRDILLSFGFEELITNVLTNLDEARGRMGRGEAPLVTIANPMTETYAVVRDAILPLLLRTESRSSMALYPHRMFEVGEVAVVDPAADHGSHTRTNACVALAHTEACFSEAHGYLDRLAFELGLEYRLAPADSPVFIPGRAARIMVGDQPVGHMGEVHPQVLVAWDIGQPVAAFELTLDPLAG